MAYKWNSWGRGMGERRGVTGGRKEVEVTREFDTFIGYAKLAVQD